MTEHHGNYRDPVERFWEKVDKSGDCWLWTACLTRGGYGCFHIYGARVRAHRYSYEMANGPIPAGKIVMHSCDNPACVRPDHLSVGTHADNMADMVEKGRSQIGETNSQAKLTEADAIAIKTDTRLHREIASDYGISIQLVGNIKNRKRWRHI